MDDPLVGDQGCNSNTPTAMSKTAAEPNSEDSITEILRRQAGSMSKREREKMESRV